MEELYTIPLSVGIDQKTDKKTLGANLSVLENAYYRKNDRLSKIPGYEQLGALDSEGQAIQGKALEVFEDELLMVSKDSLYTYSKEKNFWKKRSSFYPIEITSSKKYDAGSFSARVQTATVDSIRLTALIANSEKLYLKIEDDNTGALLYDSLFLSTDVSSVKILELSGIFYVFFLRDTADTISYITVNSSTLAVSSAVVLLSNVVGNGFDGLVVSGKIFLVYSLSSGSTFFTWYNSSLVKETGALAEKSVAFNGYSYAVEQNDSGDIMVAYLNLTTTNARAIVFDSTFAIKKADQVIYADLPNSLFNKLIIAKRATGFDIYIERLLGLINNFQIEKIQFDIATLTYSSESYVAFLSRIVSRAFYFENNYFFIIQNISDVQSTFFVIDHDSNVLARLHPDNAALSQATHNVPTSVQKLGNSFFVPLIYRTGFTLSSGDQLNTSLTRIDFDKGDFFRGVEAAGNLHVPGGYLAMYDGVQMVEHGFFLAPEIKSITPPSVSGTQYSFSYIAVYEWKDAKGNIHRSAPSIPFVITHNARGTGTVAVKVTRLFMSRKLDVKICLFGTTQDGSVHYLISRLDQLTDFTGSEPELLPFSVTIDDGDLRKNQIVYTQGGVLPNFCPPACRYLNVFNNRIFLAGLDDPYTALYSKELERGGPIEFTEDFSFTIDRDGGPITAQAVIDDKLITFKRNKIYVNYGYGPDSLGGGTYYQSPQLVPSDTGCIDQRSIGNLKEGVLYKSEKGFYLLASSLDQSPIGLAVEDFNVLTTTSVTANKEQNQVIVTHSDGLSLIYDNQRGQWSTFTPFQGIDSIRWQGKTVVLEDGKIHLEDNSIFQTFYGTNTITLETGWISLASINGFQRIKRASLVADYLGAHIVTLKVGYDHSDEWDEYVFDSSDELDPTAYSPSKLASINPKGGEGLPYTFEAHLEQQKCTAIRFRIEESIPSPLVGTGEGLSMTALSLLVGIKKGVSKKKTRIGD